MNAGELALQAKLRAQEEGFDLIGICGADPPATMPAYESWLAKGYQGSMDYLARHAVAKADPANLLPGVKSILMVGMNYAQWTSPRPGYPRIASYALGRDYHGVIRRKLKRVANALAANAPEAQFRICVDSAPLLEREFAVRAGLGWIGKNTMLINSRRGSWYLLGALLTTVELQRDEPSIGGCGTCRACIDACPTGCIVYEEDRWQIDARRCVSYLTIEHRGPIERKLAQQMGEWTFGCDICQSVCPFNQPRAGQPDRARQTAEAEFLQVRESPNLSESIELAAEAWDAFSIGSPIRRTGLAGWRRNALINLTNAQDVRDRGFEIEGSQGSLPPEKIDSWSTGSEVRAEASEDGRDKPSGS